MAHNNYKQILFQVIMDAKNKNNRVCSEFSSRDLVSAEKDAYNLDYFLTDMLNTYFTNEEAIKLADKLGY